MNVLIIGNGGRCHTLAWKIRQSSHIDHLYVAPGNGGMEGIAELVPISVTDNQGLVEFAKKNAVDLTIVGPEASLANGIVDSFQKEGLQIFGPDKKAAIIEGSKEFAKDLMKKYGIPTATYEVFETYREAKVYLDRVKTPIVIKYDGLAAGKGVVVAKTMEEADNALKEMLLNHKFGNNRVVIEECLEGPEFSLMAFVNGESVYPMVIAQDHKRAFDNDMGPNTGGMGAYSPVPIISSEDVSFAVTNIMEKTAKAMVNEGHPFLGILYGGLMKTSSGIKVIEFNARFGDPETEVVIPRLKNDLLEVILNVIMGKNPMLAWSEKSALGVVLASKGYPGNYEKGFEIKGELKDAFHMGTAIKDGKILTNGGRVLFVLGMGDTMEEAQKDAYQKVNKIQCENLFYRNDIGYQVIRRNVK